MKKETTTIFSVVIICAVLFGMSYNLKNTGISIRNTGTVGSNVQNSINVYGEGKISVTPDIVMIRAGVSETRDTTKEAQKATNQKIAKILEILRTYNVPDKNIQTSNLSFDEKYDWSVNERKIIGQEVRQTLAIKIPEIIEDSTKVTNILDELGNVDGLELNSVIFDLEDKKEAYTKAREKAFKKAQQKAEELADLSDVKLLKPITVTEGSSRSYPPIYANYAKAEMDMGNTGGESSLPSGELEITTKLNVIFGIE